MPVFQWVYFAGARGVGPAHTMNMAGKGYLWRSAFSTSGQKIAHVRNVQAGDIFLLCYEGEPQCRLKVLQLDERFNDLTNHDIPALGVVNDANLHHELDASNYVLDPDLNRFCGFHVEVMKLKGLDRRQLPDYVERSGHSTIQRRDRLRQFN